MKELFTLSFSAGNYAKPITYHLVKDYDLKITILRAEISPQENGHLLIEAEGDEISLQNALQFLAREQVMAAPANKESLKETACLQCNTCPAATFSSAMVVNKKEWRQKKVHHNNCIICGQGILSSALGPKPGNTGKYVPYWYQSCHRDAELYYFSVKYKETELWIGVNNSIYSPQLEQDALKYAIALRTQLENYITVDAPYISSLKPYQPQAACPPIARIMADTAQIAGIGPVAAAAGAFSQEIARRLATKYPLTDLIIENSGDIYLRSRRIHRIAIYAGESILSNPFGLEIDPALSPLGICTSSGTAGYLLSIGKADAVTVLAKDAALADAYATTISNMVQTPDDITRALDYSATQSDILGVVIVVGDKIRCQGNARLIKIGQ